MFAHNRPGKSDANSGNTQTDSPEAEPGAKSDVCDCLVVDCDRVNLIKCFESQIMNS